jgi:hypothetical protein
MDQSKFALPRNRIVQSSKEASGLVRPRMKIHGLWMHNISLNLFVCSPGVPADSSLVCECFARALQDTFETFGRNNKSLPKECLVWVPYLVCQLDDLISNHVNVFPHYYLQNVFVWAPEADNTVRENKNGGVLKMLTSLLGKKHFSCTGIFFCPYRAHSWPARFLGSRVNLIWCDNCAVISNNWELILHNIDFHRNHQRVMYNPGSDPDQLFGLLAACLRYVDLICDPADLVSKLAIRCNRFKFHKLEGWLWTMWSPSVIDWLYSKEGKIHFGPNSNSKVDRPPCQNQCDVRDVRSPMESMVAQPNIG